MKQDNRFNWAIAWIFTVIVVFSVMQDAGLRGITTDKDSLQLSSIHPLSSETEDVPAPTGYVSAELSSNGMVGVSGMAVEDYKNQIKATYDKYPKLKQYPGIIEQIIQIESGGDPKAKGDEGHAIGVMQINKNDHSIYGYSLKELEQNQGKNIDAGAQKIMSIIKDNNFVEGETGRKQIIYGYNQKNVPPESKVKSNKQSQIYPNYKGNKELVNSRYNNMQAAKVLFKWDTSSCFFPTTPIILEDETTKQIQNIKVGDKVLSYDLKNNKPVESEVLNVFSHIENEYLIVNNKIKVTPYHYVYAKRKG